MSAVKGFDALTREQQKQMLEFFMYRLGGSKCDLRSELAASLPVAYNAWCGSEIVSVVSTSEVPGLPETTFWRPPDSVRPKG